MRRLTLAFLALCACADPAPRLQDDTARVDVLPPLGPTCAERCATAAELCAPFALATCQAVCDDARGTCLASAGLDCLASRRCARPAPARPFAAGPYGTQVKDLAGPVTLPTSEGDWALELEWTSDASYLFLAHATATRDLFASELRPLLEASPRNVHYFFGWLSDQLGFEQARGRWQQEIQLLPMADRDHWLTHVHFVMPRLDRTDGWIGAMLTARAAMPPRYLGNGLTAFAIDRQQRIREVGMLGRLTGTGVAAELPLLQNEARAFEFELTREGRLAAQQAVVVTLATAQTAHDTIDVDVT